MKGDRRLLHSCNLHFNWAIVGKFESRVRPAIERLVKKLLEYSKEETRAAAAAMERNR